MSNTDLATDSGLRITLRFATLPSNTPAVAARDDGRRRDRPTFSGCA